jgi:cytochrome c553
MKKIVLVLACASCLVMSGFVMAAGDAAAGKEKSAACVGCHGMNGKSNNPMYPSLAGQKAPYLEKAIKAYKTGDRKDAMMSTFATALSDQDIADLAAFYSSAN